MHKNSIKLSLLLLGCLLVSACSSHYGAVKIVSSPAGAEVINDEDGTVIGTTPTTAWWKSASGNRKHVILRLKREGYYEKVSSFWLSMRHKSLEEAQNNAQAVEVVLQTKD